MVTAEPEHDGAGPPDFLVARSPNTRVKQAARWAPMLLLGAFLTEVLTLAARPLDDPDTWWHLRLGRDLIEQHSFSAPERWSTFGTVPWTPTEPLPEIVAALSDQWVGLAGVAWLFGLALVMLVLSLFLSVRLTCDPMPALAATLVGTIGCGLSVSPRPQLLSFVLLLVVIAAWRATEDDGRSRWWLVPLTWLWSMVHGFWFLGVGYGTLLAVVIALQRRAPYTVALRLGAVPVLSGLAVLLNPAGPGVFEGPFRVHATAQGIYEWQRTSLISGPPLVVMAGIGLCVVLWAVARQRPPWSSVLLLISAAFWCWYAERTVAVAAVVVAPVLARTFQSLLDRHSQRRGPEPLKRIELTVVLGWAAACLVALALTVAHTSQRPGGDVPTRLDARLDQLPPGSVVFNTYSVGGWIHWRHPNLDPMIDGLATPYSPPYIRQFQGAMYGEPGWRQFVHRADPDAALVHLDVPIVRDLQLLGWTRVATDRSYTLLLPPRS